MTIATPYRRSFDSSHSSMSSHSDRLSNHSLSTTPTVYSPRPSMQRSEDNNSPFSGHAEGEKKYAHRNSHDSTTSVETYASTIPSEEDFDDELPPFDVPDEDFEVQSPTALASTPQEFADFFPSTSRITIKHDDSTLDGNMNLRLDTAARTSDGNMVDLTLFHLRMHDLRKREFSLRRYCRDSGREICRSERKVQTPAKMSRPSLQRSMSSAISALRSNSLNKIPTIASLKRRESGFDSASEDGEYRPVSPQVSEQAGADSAPTDVISLKFQNYAHFDIRRRGAKSLKRYEFEYWGSKYTWRRITRISGDFKETSYHLVNSSSSTSIAHIVPISMSPPEVREEEAKGG